MADESSEKVVAASDEGGAAGDARKDAPRRGTSTNAIVAIVIAVLGAGGAGTALIQTLSDVKKLEAELELERGRKADAEKQLQATRAELDQKQADIQRQDARIEALGEQLRQAEQKAANGSGNSTVVNQHGSGNAGIGSSVTTTVSQP